MQLTLGNYLHAQRLVTSSDNPVTEAVPLKDYLFRYNRGGFWVGTYAFQYFKTPFNRVSRWLLDWFVHTRRMYHALHQSGLSSKYIIQDLSVPYAASEKFMAFLSQEFRQYPVWLCPLQIRKPEWEQHFGLAGERPDSTAPEYQLNFGVWGPGPSNKEDFIAWNRRLEKKVEELGGRKLLYAHAYYEEDEFWSIYDRQRYDDLRNKYHAGYLPSVYDKVKVRVDEARSEDNGISAKLVRLFWGTWPFAGLYGAYRAFEGGDYLLPRDKVVVLADENKKSQ